MAVEIRSVQNLELNEARKRWRNDPRIHRYFNLSEEEESADQAERETEYYEVHLDDEHVGDIKVFKIRDDIRRKRAQVMILIGETRRPGIGTEAIGLLLQHLKGKYDSVYCLVNRYNMASIKMLQKNGFKIEDFRGNEVLLTRSLKRSG